MSPEPPDPFDRARQRSAAVRRTIAWVLLAIALILIRQFAGTSGT